MMSQDQQSCASQKSQLFNGQRKPRIAILYHYMYPDDVISAKHLDGLAIGLANLGWEVEALPCNRGCRDEKQTYLPSQMHEGVHYNRVWRLRFRQASFIGRLANSFWMTVAWARLAFRSKERRPDIVIIGTDPVFAIAAAIPLKLFAPKIRIAHWCFDLHPEASIASGMISSSNVVIQLLKKVMQAGYRRCDIIADIGPCMRSLLRQYQHHAHETELTPWALKEPSQRVEIDKLTRQDLFGEAKLAILYSGNFGEAHSFEEILAIARSLRDAPEIHFCFAVRGNKVAELKNEVRPEDTNISFAGFASIEDLEKRLGAADIHMVTLRPEWSGIAVPSKFFGSLAIGRPVLFAGPAESGIGQWVEKYDIGWILRLENADQIAQQLRQISSNPGAILEMQNRALTTYTEKFSKEAIIKQWDIKLSGILEQGDNPK